MNYRSTKLRQAANGRPCVLCGAHGTTVGAHSTRVEHGHGTGIKAPDYFLAYVCQSHHDCIDGRRGQLTKQERHSMWLEAFAKTVAIWFEEGLVKVA